MSIERRSVDNTLMAANVVIRLGYGIGGVVAPATLARLRFAPDVAHRPDARLFVRGFADLPPRPRQSTDGASIQN